MLYVLRITIFICLLIGFSVFFVWMIRKSIIRNVIWKTYDSMDAVARRRNHEKRKMLVLMPNNNGYLYKIEQGLIYSGLTRCFPYLSIEVWIVLNMLLIVGVYFTVFILGGGMGWGIVAMAVAWFIRSLFLNLLISKNYNAVDNNLLKFLDFLGNYSITAGEVTNILNQVSKYLEEPLQSVLSECYYEAQTSGDTSLALLVMAEKIEHPKFKELIRNIEISTRYSADFTMLVSNSRRAVREYFKSRQERKALVNEAVIQMVILLGMSFFMLAAVEQLINITIWSIMFQTMVGRISLGVILFMIILLYGQVRKIDQ